MLLKLIPTEIPSHTKLSLKEPESLGYATVKMAWSYSHYFWDMTDGWTNMLLIASMCST